MCKMLQPGLVLIGSYLISSIFYYPLANHNCLKIVTTSLHISCCDSFFFVLNKNFPINLCGFFKKIPARNLDHCTLHCVASSRLFVSVGSEIVTHRVFLAVGMNLKNGRWHPFMHVLFIKSRHWFEKKYLNVTYIQIVILFWSKGVGAGWAFDKLMV